MNSSRSVCIIGGGIAGLSSAVFLASRGFKVMLVEASPKLGGRAYSFFDKKLNRFFDNGQHILAGWYKATFEYLKLIESYHKLNFQKTLEVNFVNRDRYIFKLKCPNLPAPFDLITGLNRFDAFDDSDRRSIKKILKLFFMKRNEIVKYSNAKDLLDDFDQTENVEKYFWGPFLLAVFNTRPENISAELFLNVLRKGFLKPGNSKLVIPDINLNELLIDDAVIFLKKKNSEIRLGQRVEQVVIDDDLVKEILLEDGTKIISDYYISAVPFFNFKKLFNEKDYEDLNYNSEKLKPSSIVSVHLFFENEITNDIIHDNSFGMTGMIDTKVQWIFKRSSNHLSLVISGSDELGIKEMQNEEIVSLAMKELNECLTGFDKLILKESMVVKEKRATFIPDKESNMNRPSQQTMLKNFFIAGDWTDTKLPSTIEGAVKSSKLIAEMIK